MSTTLFRKFNTGRCSHTVVNETVNRRRFGKDYCEIIKIEYGTIAKLQQILTNTFIRILGIGF